MRTGGRRAPDAEAGVSVSQAQERVRTVAKESEKERLAALLRHSIQHRFAS